MRRTRRRQWWILAGAGVGLLAVVILVGPPAMHLARTWLSDRDELEALPTGIIDDASRMNATRVLEVWDIPGSRDEAEHQLVDLLELEELLELVVLARQAVIMEQQEQLEYLVDLVLIRH